MKAIGIVRRVDQLGRLVIPKELRNIMNIPVGTPMEFFTTEDTIVIKRYGSGCSECGDTSEELVGKSQICKTCATVLAGGK